MTRTKGQWVKPHPLRSPSNSTSFTSHRSWMTTAAKSQKSEWDSRFDHVIVGGVEDVASDDPHDALVDRGLVGGPGQAGVHVLLPAPEGGVGRN